MEQLLRTGPEVVGAYFRLFVNRRAFTIQSKKPHADTGRHYYFRPKEKGTEEPVSLTVDILKHHLEGAVTIGLYALNPLTQRCKWVAIDADYKDSMEDLLKLQYHLAADKVEAALEMSKRGGHLWIFFEKPLLARECRIYIYNLALRLKVPVKRAGPAEGIEVFPKHDELRAGEFGNAIRGPLGIHRGAKRRFWFYGADYTLDRQMAYLKRLRKVTEDELRRFIAGKSVPDELIGVRRQADQAPVPYRSNGQEFRILDRITTPLRKVGRNYVTRCPACADAGHDRGGDNLAIRIEDPRFYKCWAGCTKEMIRDALGCPIRFRASA
jgi:hypothetical protein